MTALMNPPLYSPAPAAAPAAPALVDPGVYRRRRLLAMVVMAVLAYGVWSLAVDLGDRAFTGQAGAAAPIEAEAEVWVVQPGDTLWSIAVELGGEVDVRARVDALADLNGGPVLRVGQRLVLPSG